MKPVAKPPKQGFLIDRTAYLSKDAVFKVFKEEPMKSYSDFRMFIGFRAHIGPNCIIGYGVEIHDHVRLGDRVVAHNGVTIVSTCNIGTGTEIGYLSILKCLSIGELVNIGSNVFIFGQETTVGNRTTIGNNSTIAYTKIGSDVTIGKNVQFHSLDGDLDSYIIVGNGAQIGDNTEIKPGVIIPDRCIIPANYIAEPHPNQGFGELSILTKKQVQTD